MATAAADPALLGRRFEDALQYAAMLHAGQTRNGTTIPYVAHLLAVASLALEDGADEEMAIAALLHDAAEDQGGAERLRAIAARFGQRVARIVADCTDAVEPVRPPWRERKERYLRGISAKPADSLIVIAADKLHNARSILTDLRHHGDDVWQRFSGGRDGVLWYYRGLATELDRTGNGSASVRELGRTVDAIETLAQTLAQS